MATTFLRGLVSKNKRRLEQDGFSLDLSYITEQIIAMGFPSEKLEGVYRNSMKDVQRFFESRHQGHYRIYNLCVERHYSSDKFHGAVCEEFQFEDHNPPPLDMILPFCTDVSSWLKTDPANVVAIHCKAGKGRTGMMICAYLLHCGMWPTAHDAMMFYGAARTKDQEGVTIPSQRRYIEYYERIIKAGFESPPPTLLFLTNVRIHTVPHYAKGECAFRFAIQVGVLQKMRVFKSDVRKIKTRKKGDGAGGADDETGTDETVTDFTLRPVPLQGDIKFVLYDKDKKFSHFWINTSMIIDNHLVLHKEEIDGAIKDMKGHKLFHSNFAVELFFASPDDESMSRHHRTMEEMAASVPKDEVELSDDDPYDDDGDEGGGEGGLVSLKEASEARVRADSELRKVTEQVAQLRTEVEQLTEELGEDAVAVVDGTG